MVSAFVGEDLEDEDAMLISEEIHFHYPMFVGDTIRLDAQLASESESVRVREFRLVFRNQNEKKVASGKCLVRNL